ncbi:TonB-dependent receptor [Thalassospira sp. TSL5-1]|uniref:TonB-dependent receptor n=1 Tax=Thalassospira sp. TSL5-1 TaxID=1544451 RepID=UPI00093DD911|nr:TonB-dependent receptor [Thalassospira sp. TSL5-1]OKH86825.1 energy transducer TonB [Thalassospira sp. TSL5-1]
MRSDNTKNKIHALAAKLLLSTTMLVPVSAYAQTNNATSGVERVQYSFDIKAQSLAQGIAEIGAVSGWRIAYTMELPAIDTARVIRGTMSPMQALDILLKGTGFSYRSTGDNALVIVKPSSAAANGDVTTLDPIRIEAAEEQNGLPPVYAGGQVASGGQLGMLGDTDIMDAPVSITSYTSEKIEDQQAKTIADVLKNDPSVRAPNSGGGMLDTYQIRGFSINTGNSGEVAMDGAYGVAPNYRVQAGFAERIEVLKGPAALLNGMSPNGGVGGVINIVPKRAGDKDLNRVSVDYGLGEQAGGNVDFSRRFGKDKQFGVRFNGGYHNGDTYLDKQSREATLGALALDYKGEDLRLSLDLIDQREDIDAPFREYRLTSGVTMPDAPDGSKNAVQDWQWSDATDQSAMLKGEYDLADNLTLFGGVGGGRTEVDRLFGYPIITNNAGDIDDDSLSYMRFQTNRFTANAGLRGDFSTAAINHEATVSASYYADTFYRGAVYSATDPASNIYNPSSVPPIFVAAPTAKPKLSETDLRGIAVADTLSVWQDQVKLTLGARHQSIETNNFNGTTGVKTAHYKDSVITPMVGLVVKPTDYMSVYANYLEGLSKGDIAPSSAANAGEAMAPYVAKQIETGIKLDFGTFGGSAALFQITKPSGQTVNNVYNSDAEQRNRGLELNVFGEVTPDVRLLAGVMFLDAELTKTNSAATKGNRPVGTPKMQANLTAEWDTPFAPGLTLNGTITHTAEQYINTANSQDIPDWTTLDLGLRYKTTISDTPVTVRATIQNVTNESYWSGVNDYSMISLGAPRTALVSLTADF